MDRDFTTNHDSGRHDSVSILLKEIAEAGLEPARPLRTRDFKSRASAIPPLGHVL